MQNFRKGIDLCCPRCHAQVRGTSLPGEKPSLLELLEELKGPKPEDPKARAERIRARALERIAVRVKLLTWRDAHSGHAVVGPFAWRRLLAARAWLARIDEAIAAGEVPPEEPMDQR